MEEEIDMKSFDDLWRFICKRSECFPVVQEYHELEYVFNKMQGCGSYLEVGTAEGNSMYVLSHALHNGARVVSVDYGEKHTKEASGKVFEHLKTIGVWDAYFLTGNSHAQSIVTRASSLAPYDIVLIDAGHSYEDVIADAVAYGSLATKYIFFHDVMLPEVGKAFDWYCKQRPECKSYRIVNSEKFGYGIMEIKQ